MKDYIIQRGIKGLDGLTDLRDFIDYLLNEYPIFSKQVEELFEPFKNDGKVFESEVRYDTSSSGRTRLSIYFKKEFDNYEIPTKYSSFNKSFYFSRDMYLNSEFKYVDIALFQEKLNKVFKEIKKTVDSIEPKFGGKK
ncbi:hypothetical protein [Spiroplasma sp. DGKH1]|uniref:hypothetical protein n=1 Tax=Spiroplasma sp. DGKH1 TaxID=3050074 RepID=UPI0034C6083B